jgi:hypothetical protein
MTRYVIRYAPGSDLALRFPHLRYPARTTFPTREKADEVRRLCPNAEDMVVVELNEEEG